MYAKLFTSIYQGTLRGNSHGLLVFTNLLAHADIAGSVDIHPKAIAEEVGLSLEQVRAALDVLESPDSESRSPEQEGRRIVRMDVHRAWGWSIVNHAKYRAIRNEEDRREQNRLSQAKYRAKAADSNQSKPSKPPSAHTEAEAETTTDTREKKTRAVAPVLLLPAFVDPKLWAVYLDLRKTKRAGVKESALQLILQDLKVMAMAGHDANQILGTSIKRGWVGVFEPKSEGKGQMTFKERDSENAAARVREMTGGLVSAKPTTRRNDALQEVFDAPKRLG